MLSKMFWYLKVLLLKTYVGFLVNSVVRRKRVLQYNYSGQSFTFSFGLVVLINFDYKINY